MAVAERINPRSPEIGKVGGQKLIELFQNQKFQDRLDAHVKGRPAGPLIVYETPEGLRYSPFGHRMAEGHMPVGTGEYYELLRIISGGTPFVTPEDLRSLQHSAFIAKAVRKDSKKKGEPPRTHFTIISRYPFSKNGQNLNEIDPDLEEYLNRVDSRVKRTNPKEYVYMLQSAGYQVAQFALTGRSIVGLDDRAVEAMKTLMSTPIIREAEVAEFERFDVIPYDIKDLLRLFEADIYSDFRKYLQSMILNAESNTESNLTVHVHEKVNKNGNIYYHLAPGLTRTGANRDANVQLYAHILEENGRIGTFARIHVVGNKRRRDGKKIIVEAKDSGRIEEKSKIEEDLVPYKWPPELDGNDIDGLYQTGYYVVIQRDLISKKGRKIQRSPTYRIAVYRGIHEFDSYKNFKAEYTNSEDDESKRKVLDKWGVISREFVIKPLESGRYDVESVNNGVEDPLDTFVNLHSQPRQ